MKFVTSVSSLSFWHDSWNCTQSFKIFCFIFYEVTILSHWSENIDHIFQILFFMLGERARQTCFTTGSAGCSAFFHIWINNTVGEHFHSHSATFCLQRNISDTRRRKIPKKKNINKKRIRGKGTIFLTYSLPRFLVQTLMRAATYFHTRQ